ncbi:MAG: Trk family potassium uptake protein [Angelakisella sp.]|nr:Trk family potassium uptake protein [Angelakisella sp.]
MQKVVHWRRYLTSFQLIILGFAGVILLGALILMLPVASASGAWTSFRESLFTSTSAVCVTGLVIYDSGSYWSGFGQGVILLLIQIGGLGVITMAATFLMLAGKNISLKERSAMQDAISAPAVGGIVRLTRFILKGTFFIELLGALAMLPVFCRDYGSRGIWMSVFHSVSAFCNAGFDILGRPGNLYPSLTAYIADPLINIIVVLLIVTGGIGFLTWDDVCTHRLHLRRYRMQSKVILAATGLLILFPAVLFFFTDFSDLPMEQRFLASLFQAVTPRTAGYNTADLTAMTEASRAVMTVLMLIGGAPGSTAGGMKVTTLTVLTANAFATFRRRAEPQLFHRRLEGAAVRNASTILMLYLTLFFTGAVIISTAEGLPLSACLYETASAVGTVGLTLGLTPQLGALSQWILIVLMFLGRVGGLTLIYAAYSGRDLSCARFPQEKITVG